MLVYMRTMLLGEYILVIHQYVSTHPVGVFNIMLLGEYILVVRHYVSTHPVDVSITSDVILWI